MSSGDLEPAVAQLKTDEGFTPVLRVDTRGNMFIGYGLTPKKGITKRVALAALREQVAEAADDLSTYYWWSKLNSVRIAVIIGISVNGGVNGLLHYPKMLAAVAIEDWKTAAAEIRNSDSWKSSDLHDRYERYAQMMELGVAAVATS